MDIPRIVIAGVSSGVGKTSVSLALMSACMRAGYRVQAFKVGPDYIDPGYHKVVTGFPSHNLDPWLCSSETVQELFRKKSDGADISIIEGVMGLYDGLSGKDETASTAQIAKLLRAPVLLVLDARSLSRSSAAMVKGYQLFDPEIKLAGVILNKVGSPRHLELLTEAIEYYTNVPVVGAIFRDEKIQIPERHLGLVTASENKELKNSLDSLAGATQYEKEKRSGIDVEKIMKIAKDVTRDSWPVTRDPVFVTRATSDERRVRIALASDRAFNFYYQANLDLLSELGAELISFSPCSDEKLPGNCSALYFGGGFPEIFAYELEENEKLKLQIKQLVEKGLPVYAECGGLMYLSDSIETLEGKSYSMVGVVPGKIVMTKKLQNFGYKQGKMRSDTLLGLKGEVVRGHEFHYSARIHPHPHPLPSRERIPEGQVRGIDNIPYELTDRKSETIQLEGYAGNSLLASYLHLHFLTNPRWAQSFIQQAKNYQQKKEVALK